MIKTLKSMLERLSPRTRVLAIASVIFVTIAALLTAIIIHPYLVLVLLAIFFVLLFFGLCVAFAQMTLDGLFGVGWEKRWDRDHE